MIECGAQAKCSGALSGALFFVTALYVISHASALGRVGRKLKYSHTLQDYCKEIIFTVIKHTLKFVGFNIGGLDKQLDTTNMKASVYPLPR